MFSGLAEIFPILDQNASKHIMNLVWLICFWKSPPHAIYTRQEPICNPSVVFMLLRLKTFLGQRKSSFLFPKLSISRYVQCTDYDEVASSLTYRCPLSNWIKRSSKSLLHRSICSITSNKYKNQIMPKFSSLPESQFTNYKAIWGKDGGHKFTIDFNWC